MDLTSRTALSFASSLAIVLASLGASSAAHAQSNPEAEAPTAASASGGVTNTPHHEGFTMELGLGASLMNVAPEGNIPSETKFGLAPLSVSLGAFVSPKVAILARAAGTSFFAKNGYGESTQFASSFYGAHIQYWINDDLMISGGPGVMVYGENPFFGHNATDPVVGYGLSARVAYAFVSAKHHSVRLALEAFPAKYDKAFVFGSALNLEWQYF